MEQIDALNIAFKNSSEALVDQSLGKMFISVVLHCQNLQESNFITTKSSDTNLMKMITTVE
jgi:hypothetical protein